MFKNHPMLLVVLALFLIVLAMPQTPIIPVSGATPNDWNHETFWYEPWGTSGVHKGIDISAETGTPVVAATSGVVVYSGWLEKGGNVVVILSSKWRIHYHAHLDEVSPSLPVWLTTGEVIGSVGASGNAQGKAAHLHYSIVSLVPIPWLVTRETQGWKRMFYLNPHELLLRA